MDAPKVSVLLPARDAAATVDLAVRSILCQSLGSLELVAIDDGSKDATLTRLHEWARRDPRVRVVETGGTGLVGALRAGLALARAPLIARMDADDESLPERLARSVAALEADPTLWAVGTQVEVFREDRPPSPNLQLYAGWLNALTSPERVERERFIESPLCHPSATIRRDALERVGGWREGDFAEDYALWLELIAQGGRLRAVPEVLLRWRDHEARMTRTDARYRPEAHLALKARYLARALGQQPLWVWGAGNRGLKLARALRELGGEVRGLIDVSPRKVGQRIDGWPVIAPAELPAPGQQHLIAAVGAKGAREEIRRFLGERGWEEGPDFTCAA